MQDLKPPALPWTNVYGAGRSLLATGTLVTLLFNSAHMLFTPMGGAPTGAYGSGGMAGYSLFFLLPPHLLEAGRWACIAVLLLAASGWRPRITGVLHWYVAFSFAAASVMVDGGDHVAAVLALLLVPVTLTDGRRWHWQRPHADPARPATVVQAEVARSALLVIRLQVAMIYFHAAVGKMAVDEWANGTAVYYWFTHPVFGLAQSVQPLAMPLLSSSLLITLLTWGVMVLELALFLGLAVDRRWRPALLAAGLSFHLGIIVVHGLVSFFFSMAAALVLFLRPTDAELRLPRAVTVPVPSLARIRALLPARVRPAQA